MDMIVPLSARAGCASAREILSQVGDKWTILVIAALGEQPLRFNDMKRHIGGVSQQMLTRTLRRLERDGLIKRTVHTTIPPQVDYALTNLGRSLAIPMLELGRWALAHLPAIDRNRAEYDATCDAALR